MSPADADFNLHDRSSSFEHLGLTPYLARREIIRLGDLPLHLELYHYVTGAPCILFLPGIGTYSELYCESLAKLSSSGFNVLSVDLRGHGYSGGQRGDYRVKQVVADLQQVLDLLEQRYGSPIGVLGCSIGSRLGLALAEADNRVKALLCHTLFIAERPLDFWHWWGWKNLAMLSLWWPQMPIDFRTFINIQQILEQNPVGQYAIYDDKMVWHYTAATLHSIFSEPCLVLSQPIEARCALLIGEQDAIIPTRYAKALAQGLAQPFEYIELAGAGHMLPFERLDEWVSQCSEWFNRSLLIPGSHAPAREPDEL